MTTVNHFTVESKEALFIIENEDTINLVREAIDNGNLLEFLSNELNYQEFDWYDEDEE